MVASQDVGQLGDHESSPASITWRWYHHLPSLGLWVVLLVLLVLVRANRRLPAWLIWLPVLAVVLGWSMLGRLLFLPPEAAEVFGGFLTALAASWAAVWLLAPWLTSRHFLAGMFLAMAVMLVVGGVYYLNVYDFLSPNGPEILSAVHVAGALSLLVATVLAAHRCRRAYRPRRFLAWLLVWMMVIPVISTPLVMLVFVSSSLFWTDGILEIVSIALSVLMASVIGGAVLGLTLYLLNLPFLLLATRNGFYRARFQAALGLTLAVAEIGSDAASEDEAPTVETLLATLVKEP